MTRDEYERSKQRLEDQRRSGVELVETAYQAQLRALDLIWMLQARETGTGPAASFAAPPVGAPASGSSPAPPPSPRRGIADVEEDVRAVLPRLPETFTRGDVCKLLGYDPDRGALYRLLGELTQEGTLEIESMGAGRRGSVYRKTATAHSPPPA